MGVGELFRQPGNFRAMSKTQTLTGSHLIKLAGEGTIVLGLTLFLPFMVHLLPSWDDSPLGAHLLPIFYAPLGALILNRMGIALVASVLAPWVNHFLTGQPAVPMAVLLCFQLVLFLVTAALLMKRAFPSFLLGPGAYVPALGVSCLLGSLLQVIGRAFPLSLGQFAPSLWNALPGLLILAFIGWWFSRNRPTSA